MREVSLNDPLSGDEIKAICIQKFADALDRDSTLTGDFTYPGFSLKFEATIGFVRASIAGTMVWQDTVVGEKPKDGSVADSVAGNYTAPDSPNLAREENNLPMPVMINTPSGPKRQKVKYVRPTGKK